MCSSAFWQNTEGVAQCSAESRLAGRVRCSAWLGLCINAGLRTPRPREDEGEVEPAPDVQRGPHEPARRTHASAHRIALELPLVMEHQDIVPHPRELAKHPEFVVVGCDEVERDLLLLKV